LDFNQHTREINVFDVLLEVQSPVKQGGKSLFCPGALNSKAAKVVLFFTSSEASDTRLIADALSLFHLSLLKKALCFLCFL
jgi:hypothetical protein